MKLALVQMSMKDRMDQNLKKILQSIDEAAAKGADSICFPEVQLSPFFPQYPGRKATQYALPIDGEIVQQIPELKKT
jgi:predicted amidohydrolase